MQKRVIQRKQTCHPMRKCVIQCEKRVIQCRKLVIQGDIQRKNVLSSAKKVFFQCENVLSCAEIV